MPFSKGDPNINRKGRIDGGGGLKAYDRKKFEKMSDIAKDAFLETLTPELRYRMAEGNPHQTEESKVEVTLPKPLLAGESHGDNHTSDTKTTETKEE